MFYLDSYAESIDHNAILGLFTWDDNPEQTHREIDIEISQWTDPQNENVQYVIQPWTVGSNIYRFMMPESIASSA